MKKVGGLFLVISIVLGLLSVSDFYKKSKMEKELIAYVENIYPDYAINLEAFFPRDFIVAKPGYQYSAGEHLKIILDDKVRGPFLDLYMLNEIAFMEFMGFVFFVLLFIVCLFLNCLINKISQNEKDITTSSSSCTN